MPRKARQKAESGIYHVMLRGIDRQLIFEDSEDYLRFLNRTENARCRSAAREMDENMLYWYCGARSRDGLPPRVRL